MKMSQSAPDLTDYISEKGALVRSLFLVVSKDSRGPPIGTRSSKARLHADAEKIGNGPVPITRRARSDGFGACAMARFFAALFR